MLMSAESLLRRNPRPSEAEVRDALAGVLCRCTGYRKIVEAVLAVADGVAVDGPRRSLPARPSAAASPASTRRPR